MNYPDRIIMGSAHDIMQTFAYKEIRLQFRDFDGWGCLQVPSPRMRDMTCILSREIRGRKETAVVVVSFDEEPSLQSFDAPAASLKGPAFKGRYLIVPKAAKVSAIPKPVHIITMESFGFVEGKLVWLNKKKNAKHYPQPEEPVKAEPAPSACEPYTA
jgi:hypothetical protein